MSRRKTLWLLIGFQTVYILFIAVWLFIAGMSVMSFNDASVFTHATTWLFIAYIFAYPLGLLAALIAGWLLYKRQKYGAALLWNAFPLLWILSIICVFAFA